MPLRPDSTRAVGILRGWPLGASARITAPPRPRSFDRQKPPSLQQLRDSATPGMAGVVISCIYIV